MNKFRTIAGIILILWGLLFSLAGIGILLDEKNDLVAGIITTIIIGILPFGLGLYLTFKNKFRFSKNKTISTDSLDENFSASSLNLGLDQIQSQTSINPNILEKMDYVNTKRIEKIIKLVKKFFLFLFYTIKFPFLVLAVIFGITKYCANCKKFKAKKISEKYLYSNYKYERKDGNADLRYKDNPEYKTYRRFFKCENCGHECKVTR
ncbi:MAG TPA: hypothetical protein PK564_01940 [bacterium]|nr:hypothetical protein [bacterium]